MKQGTRVNSNQESYSGETFIGFQQSESWEQILLDCWQFSILLIVMQYEVSMNHTCLRDTDPILNAFVGRYNQFAHDGSV
jgi:hypothetical protein